MTNSVILRPVQARDFDVLSRIMFDTWYADESVNETNVSQFKQMARFDVAHYLETSTHAMVAVQKDEHQLSANDGADEETVLGVAMWRNDSDWFHGTTQKHLADDELKHAYKRQEEDHEFATMLDEFLADAQRTIELSKKAADQSEAELRLFMMDESARGKGVGKKLLSYAEKSMKDSGAQQYYLYTDSTCDYGFYDYIGMTRTAEAFNVPGPSGEPLDKFIYTGTL
ncbi:GNAT family N-acetyltransferase [Alloscardovia theropitheci]|nr:GNAT family N-acetyltransferase [Alloscardovia theropitheci]